MADQTILELDSLIPARPKVKLPTPTGNRRSFLRRRKASSKLYELTLPSDMGILELRGVERLSKKIAQFEGREHELNDEQVEVMKGALDELAVMLVRAPASVVNALEDWQKLAIVQNFHSMFPASEGDAPLSTTGS